MFIGNNVKLPGAVINLLKRFKHKDTHWSVIRKKKDSIQRALDHFDDFYKGIFRRDWPSIRKGLLAKQKYVAVVNNFSDADDIKTKLENIGALNLRTMFDLEKQYLNENLDELAKKKLLKKIWLMDKELDRRQEEVQKMEPENKTDIDNKVENNNNTINLDESRIIVNNNNNANMYEFIPATKMKGMEDFISESKHYKYYDNTDFPVKVEKQMDFHFPESLNIYSFDSNDYSDFESPKKGSTGVYDYYLMDGGSVLPVLALDIKPGDRVFDMCCAPGGKTYLSLQTLYPSMLFCNDVSKSRVDRIYNVMRQYLYDLEEKWLSTKKLKIQMMDGRFMRDEEFHKILVDVPCTTDRHSVNQNENNIFRADRIKERLKLPELQSELLLQALKLVCNGGVVVYSTCSLSPIQNDGVVHMTLKRIWEETKYEFKIIDLSVALMQTNKFYNLANLNTMRYGHLVVPSQNLNFGPTYFCKLQRIK